MNCLITRFYINNDNINYAEVDDDADADADADDNSLILKSP